MPAGSSEMGRRGELGAPRARPAYGRGARGGAGTELLRLLTFSREE